MLSQEKIKSTLMLCSKRFLITNIIQEKMITVPKKPLFLVLRYIRQLQLETTAKSRKSFKGTLNCSKLQILFRAKANYQTLFILKDHLPKELTSGVIHKFH